jgi:subtilase family serine protease
MRRFSTTLFAVLLLSSISSCASPTRADAQTVSMVMDHPLIFRPTSLTTTGSPPFVPSDLWNAYDFLPLYSEGIKGNGTRIAIIDAYGDPSLSTDLASFDLSTRLPRPHLNLYYPDGVPRILDSGWAVETALDVEWAHAIAPAATIDLVVSLNDSLGSIFDGMQYVASSLPNETSLSMSFGQDEHSFPTSGPYTIAATHQLFVNITSHGTAVFAASGDFGAVGCCDVSYPASDPLVVAVGGTSLTLNPDGSYLYETTWSGSSAGSSIIFPKPSWQQGLGDPMRDVVDVSYDADPNTGVMVVQGGIQFEVGGTSIGSPQWAALGALASQANHERYGALNSQLYQLSSYHDITTGSDGFFSATVGWDYPTGLGTPDATALVNALAPPMPVSLNDTQTFQGVSVTTNADSLQVALSNATLSGTILVTARNSTTGVSLFSKNYTITGMRLTNQNNGLSTIFLLRVAVAPYALSADIRIGETGRNIVATVTVTRQADVDNVGVVNIVDLAFVARLFGLTSNSPGYDGRADLNGDGVINIVDLVVLATLFNAPAFD